MILNNAQTNDVLVTTISKESERSPKVLMKSVIIFLSIAAIILATVSLLNYRFNPLTYSRSEQAKAAAVLANGRNIAIPDSNLDWRELRREHIKLMKDTPDVVIFGGSRWQEASSKVAPTKRIYNAFISSDHFEDMMAISELLYSSHRMPKTLVLSVRFSTFEYLDRRNSWWWKSFSPEYRAMANRLGIAVPSRWETLPIGKWLHLLSADAMLDKLKQYRSVSVLWRPTNSLSDPVLDVVGADGALRFSEKHLRTYTPAYAEEDAFHKAKEDRNKRLKINRIFLDQLETLLMFLKNNHVRVVLAQTPFHPTFFSAIKGYPFYEDLMQIETETNRIAEKTGTLVVGSFDAVKEGCDASDYRDFNHARIECLRRIVAQIPNL